MPNQYENHANLEAHIRTTGPEIWRQTEGRVTHFVAVMSFVPFVIECFGRR